MRPGAPNQPAHYHSPDNTANSTQLAFLSPFLSPLVVIPKALILGINSLEDKQKGQFIVIVTTIAMTSLAFLFTLEAALFSLTTSAGLFLANPEGVVWCCAWFYCFHFPEMTHRSINNAVRLSSKEGVLIACFTILATVLASHLVGYHVLLAGIIITAAVSYLGGVETIYTNTKQTCINAYKHLKESIFSPSATSPGTTNVTETVRQCWERYSLNSDQTGLCYRG